MKRELRAFSRSQVWFALGIGAIGFGGLFAVYSYVAPLATEVTGLPAVDGARRAHRVRPGHDDRQPRRRTARRLERAPQHVRVLRRSWPPRWCCSASPSPNPVGLFTGVFLVGASSAALSPTIQARLMDVARDSQSIAAALNHSALNIGNSIGALLGGIAIAAGLGYVAPIWIGLVLTIAGVLLALASFALDRSRGRRGVVVPYATGAVEVVE